MTEQPPLVGEVSANFFIGILKYETQLIDIELERKELEIILYANYWRSNKIRY
jgi:hypothetical protein